MCLTARESVAYLLAMHTTMQGACTDSVSVEYVPVPRAVAAISVSQMKRTVRNGAIEPAAPRRRVRPTGGLFDSVVSDEDEELATGETKMDPEERQDLDDYTQFVRNLRVARDIPNDTERRYQLQKILEDRLERLCLSDVYKDAYNRRLRNMTLMCAALDRVFKSALFSQYLGFPFAFTIGSKPYMKKFDGLFTGIAQMYFTSDPVLWNATRRFFACMTNPQLPFVGADLDGDADGPIAQRIKSIENDMWLNTKDVSRFDHLIRLGGTATWSEPELTRLSMAESAVAGIGPGSLRDAGMVASAWVGNCGLEFEFVHGVPAGNPTGDQCLAYNELIFGSFGSSRNIVNQQWREEACVISIALRAFIVVADSFFCCVTTMDEFTSESVPDVHGIIAEYAAPFALPGGVNAHSYGPLREFMVSMIRANDLVCRVGNPTPI